MPTYQRVEHAPRTGGYSHGDARLPWGVLNAVVMALLLSAAASRTAQPGEGPPRMVLVDGGAARAAVILPDEPISAQAFAAEELLYHVRKATGAKLPLHRENDAPADAAFLVYVGPCRATVAAGVDVETLPPSGHVVRTVGNALFLAGRDRDRGKLGHYWTADWQGTLYAVYDFLETEMGVRWLWPGELGEHIPQRRDLVIGSVDRSGRPRFLQAWLRPAGLKPPGHLPGWSSAESKAAFHEAQRVFLLRHRLGAVENLGYGHAFGRYWRRFGKTNPEFFSRLPDGTRRPLDGNPGGEYITMCVSDSIFRSRVVATWVRSRERNPKHVPYRPRLNACENDTPGMCTCAECRAWDGPDPAFATHAYWGRGLIPDRSRRFTLARTPWGELAEGDAVVAEPPSLSDRYARFYMELLREAREKDPGAGVAGYAYANYWKAPVTPRGDLDLHGVLVVYVPAIGFPYTREMSEGFRANWTGWSRLGAKLVLRPNLTHAGANLPIFYARQIASDFSYAAQHGMVGTYFDSLLGAWSTQGPTLYVLTRIHQRPDWPVDRILDEYYGGFGPAEEGVRAYFGYWERHSNALDADEVRRYGAAERGGSFKNYVRIAHRLFAPNHFAQARTLLEAARRQAGDDARARRRVAYLEQGLTDAELTTAARAAQARKERENSEANRVAFDAAFRRLVEHRAVMEAKGDHPANIGYFAYREHYGASWPHLRRPSEDQLMRETAFQARWPARRTRDPAQAGLRLVAQQRLPRTGWHFRKDPDRCGDRLGWHRAEADTADWREVPIETAWATFLGEPYVGAGWYRRSIKAPALPASGAAYLHFGAVDESCWVWVNGEYAGRHHVGPNGWNVSFRIEITNTLRPGENVVTVRAMNTTAAGGIWRPVRVEVYGSPGG